MRALEFIRDHVTFKLPYDFSYHMKNPFLILHFMTDLSIFFYYKFQIFGLVSFKHYKKHRTQKDGKQNQFFAFIQCLTTTFPPIYFVDFKHCFFSVFFSNLQILLLPCQDISGVLLRRQILKLQLSHQMLVRKLLIFSSLFLLSNLKYISNKCFQDKM